MSGRGGFEPGESARSETIAIEHEHLEMPNFAGLASVMSGVRDDPSTAPGAVIADADLRSAYIDALVDLHKLVEEYRFEVALAHLLALDVRKKVEQGLAEQRKPNPTVDPFGLPDETRVVLLAYMREPPSATQLFADPHVLMTGDRRFSGWVAGQMLDGALFRGVAVCDRLATLLWARAGMALPTRDGRSWLPSFTSGYVAQLRPHYDAHPDWPAWEALLTHAIYEAARGIRNRFTHERRLASQLHGERVVSRLEGPTIAGLEIADHLALGLAMYDLVVRPGVEATGSMVAVAE